MSKEEKSTLKILVNLQKTWMYKNHVYMMDIHKKIEQFISQHALISDNAKIVVGLSGGPDSVFLLHFLATLQKKKNISLIAAHLNHEWRSQADEEENLCRSIAQRLNIPFVSAKISTLTASYK